MRTLNRYVIREIAAPFFLSLFIFTFVLLLDRIMKLVELVVSRGVGLSDIGMLFIYILPSFLTLTIPMSLLLSVLLAFGRLSSEGEFTAMKASGISLYQMLKPVSIVSVAAYLLTSYIMIYALPWGNQSFRAKVFEIAREKASTGIKERIFNDDFEGIVLYVDGLKEDKMRGILIFDQREREGVTIFAEEGGIVSNPKAMTVTMRLSRGEIHRAGRGLSYQRLDFATYDLRLNFKGSVPDGKATISKGDREMTVGELRGRIEELRGRGEDYRPYQVELHKKFSIPFACVVFGLIGVPLGIQSRRSGRAFGFLLSLGILLFYYISLIGGENLADRGIVSPFLSMWGSNILFLLLGVYLLITVGRDREIHLMNWMDSALVFMEGMGKRVFKRGD